VWLIELNSGQLQGNEHELDTPPFDSGKAMVQSFLNGLRNNGWTVATTDLL
jgi:hypothetical protein